MKITKFLAVFAVFSLIAACGSSGNSPTPTPTSTETQVAASAATEKVISAGGQAVINTIFAPTATALVEKAAGESFEVNQTVNCHGADATYGTVHVTGTVAYTCESTTCTVTNSALALAFDNCQKTVTLTAGGTTYNVVLNNLIGGETNATLVGVATTNASTGIVTVDVSGALSGSVAVTGDVAGTVVLDGIDYTVTGDVPPDGSSSDLTPGCSGTCSVTITEPAATQECTVATDCNGCSS